jgi:hypothetical protein
MRRGLRPLPRELRCTALYPMAPHGQVAYVTTAPRGEPDGLVLPDGTVIKLTPPGAHIQAWGHGVRNRHGRTIEVDEIAELVDAPSPA